MRTWSSDTRWRAAAAAGVIFVFGMAAGVAVDRTLAHPAPLSASVAPVTVEDLAASLRLDRSQQARVNAVLDSVRPEIARAAAGGADSLRLATRRARARLLEALPQSRRGDFEQWLDAHHARMMEMMNRMGPGMMGPRGAGPGTMGRGMMGPGGMMGQ